MSKIKAVYNFKCRHRYLEKIGSKTADKVAEKETIHVIHRVYVDAKQAAWLKYLMAHVPYNASNAPSLATCIGLQEQHHTPHRLT